MSMTVNRIIANNGSSIVLYTTDDGNTQLEVKLEKNTVWLTQSQMAELFGRDRTVVGRHIRNIFKEGELDETLVCAKNALPKKYGRREDYSQLAETTFYNLDVIISVGYRVKSIKGTKFRIWASALIKQYLIKGYAIDQRRLDHYDELKDVVRLMSRALTQLMEQNRIHVNEQLPACCKLAEIEIHKNEFEKTPKKSIKRYLYK